MRFKILGLLAAIVVITSACMSVSNDEVMAEQPKVVKEIQIMSIETPEPTLYPDFDLEHLSIVRKENGDVTSRIESAGEYTENLTGTEDFELEPVEDSGFTDKYVESWGDGESSDSDTSGREPELIYLGDWTTTAYCPCEICCGEWATGCTASGVLATSNHTVACGILPFGTQIMIDGQIYTVEDTGVEGEWIDIFFDTHDEALNYGMQTKSIYLVEE